MTRRAAASSVPTDRHARVLEPRSSRTSVRTLAATSCTTRRQPSSCASTAFGGSERATRTFTGSRSSSRIDRVTARGARTGERRADVSTTCYRSCPHPETRMTSDPAHVPAARLGASTSAKARADLSERRPYLRLMASCRPGRSPTCRRRRRSRSATLFKVIGPGRDHGGDVDRRRRVARRPCRRGQVLVGHLPDRDGRDRAAGALQPRGHPLHALHRRADLRRHHAAQARAAILGRLLHRHRLLPARVAGAGRQRRGDADRRVDGPHAGRARAGHAGLGGRRA